MPRTRARSSATTNTTATTTATTTRRREHTHSSDRTPCTPQVRSLTHTPTHAHAHDFAASRTKPVQPNPRGFVLSRSRPAVDRVLGQSRTSSICKLDAQAEAAKAGANQDGLGLRGVWRRHHRQKCWRGDQRARDWDDWTAGEEDRSPGGGRVSCRDEATGRSIGGVGRDTHRVDGRRGQGTLAEPVWR